MTDLNTSSSYDVAVAYRIYPRVSGPAVDLPFGDNKLRQAEICLRSFKKSLGGIRVKLWAILDGCPTEFEDMFRRYFSDEDLVIIRVSGKGNCGTFSIQLDELLKQVDAPIVYFAEDDYLYNLGEFPLLVDLLVNASGVDFVTAFDHPDSYYLDLHRLPKWLRIHGNHHWSNAVSTCHTFLTTRKILAEYESVFRTCTKGNLDASQWVSITKYRIFNLAAIVRYLSTGNFLGRVLVKSWLYSWRQNIFGRRAKLWSPIPTIAGHLDSKHIATGFDLVGRMIEEDLT